MTIIAVETAIQKIREMVKEWDDVELNHWREDQTRYALIDPIIRALDWDTSDPKECHPEYPRLYPEGRSDYCLFGTPDVDAIGNNSVPPDVIIESKAFRTPLDEVVAQLQSYVEDEPVMRNGVGVITDGGDWWIYDVSKRGSVREQARRAVGYTDREPAGVRSDPGPVAEPGRVRLILTFRCDVTAGNPNSGLESRQGFSGRTFACLHSHGLGSRTWRSCTSKLNTTASWPRATRPYLLSLVRWTGPWRPSGCGRAISTLWILPHLGSVLEALPN